MDDPHSCAIFKQQSCSAFVIWCLGTRQAMAGVAAHRTVTASIVKAPALLTCIVYRFLEPQVCLLISQDAVTIVTGPCEQIKRASNGCSDSSMTAPMSCKS